MLHLPHVRMRGAAVMEVCSLVDKYPLADQTTNSAL